MEINIDFQSIVQASIIQPEEKIKGTPATVNVDLLCSLLYESVAKYNFKLENELHESITNLQVTIEDCNKVTQLIKTALWGITRGLVQAGLRCGDEETATELFSAIDKLMAVQESMKEVPI